MVAIKSVGHSRGLEFISVLEKWIYENFLGFFVCLNRGREKR